MLADRVLEAASSIRVVGIRGIPVRFKPSTLTFYRTRDVIEMKSTNRLALLTLIFIWALIDAGAATAGARDKPLKVFILAGQSNMQGHAKVSTLDSLADDPRTAPLLRAIRSPDGKPRVCEKVWISSVGCAGDGYADVIEQTGKMTIGFGTSSEEIGPEFTFGLTVEERLGGPILIIKTSWGGRNLHTDFRPPSAGPEKINDFTLNQWKERGLDVEKEAEKIRKNGGVFYRHMIDHVRKVLKDIRRVVPDYDPKQGYELAGFVWFQGFNDLVDTWTYPDGMMPGGYGQYAELLGRLIRDVRKDLSSPKLPFVIGVMGIGGEKEGKKAPQMYFRQAQVAPPRSPSSRALCGWSRRPHSGTATWTRCKSGGRGWRRNWIRSSRRIRDSARKRRTPPGRRPSRKSSPRPSRNA